MKLPRLPLIDAPACYLWHYRRLPPPPPSPICGRSAPTSVTAGSSACDNDGNELAGRHSAGLRRPGARRAACRLDRTDGIYVSSRGQGANTPKILIYDCDANGAAPRRLLPVELPACSPTLANTAQPAQLRIRSGRQSVRVGVIRPRRSAFTIRRPAQRLPDAASNLPAPAELPSAQTVSCMVGTSAVPRSRSRQRFRDSSNGQPGRLLRGAASGELGSPASLLFLPNGDLLAVDSRILDRIRRFSGQTGTDLRHVLPRIPTDHRRESQAFRRTLSSTRTATSIVGGIGSDQSGIRITAVQLLRYELDGTSRRRTYQASARTDRRHRLDAVADKLSIGRLRRRPQIVEAADYTKWKADFGKWVAKGNGADGNNNGSHRRRRLHGLARSPRRPGRRQRDRPDT